MPAKGILQLCLFLFETEDAGTWNKRVSLKKGVEEFFEGQVKEGGNFMDLEPF